MTGWFNSKGARRLLSALYLLAVVATSYWLLRSEWETIVDNALSVGLSTLVLAFGCSILALLASMLSYRVLLQGMAQRLSLTGAFRIYFVSQLGKYLPGSVWPALVQVRLGTEYGVSRSVNLTCFFLGLILSIAIGGATGFVVLASIDPATWLLPALVSLLALAVGFALLSSWSAVVGRLPQFLRTRLPPEPPDRGAVAVACLLLVVSWLLHGLQVAVLARSLDLQTDDLVLRSIGAFSLAYAGGVLFVVAPAGAGVREALMIGVLGRSQVATVAAIVLLSRVILLIADLLLGLSGALFTRWLLPSSSRKEPV